ncbi:hypothetical protein Skr01_11890 [Sphaerisporangium krabiense]|uniref:Transcriptional regulator with XRE-family HTH domain n=1 Tax=Sphaerisporangium krabiense TaxID=763782 RepID=A0A7W9DU40_9ACTN|nr:helix-turn-helix transcriptional regulator [Sphaerisporangium krabiense]MBB5631283.1 transcriptional regulator with XRE-family HTH domain [Sphaerisporangium krabiense]GII61104.1 hypothetical protein Skr01_11890 [Sphaerisporangium krabiense]
MIDPSRVRTPEELSQQLRALFRQGKWSHQRLAEAAGLSPATVHGIVSGATTMPRTGTLVAFVTACGEDKEQWLMARRRVAAGASAAYSSREELKSEVERLRARAERAEAALEALLRNDRRPIRHTLTGLRASRAPSECSHA